MIDPGSTSVLSSAALAAAGQRPVVGSKPGSSRPDADATTVSQRPSLDQLPDEPANPRRRRIAIAFVVGVVIIGGFIFVLRPGSRFGDDRTAASQTTTSVTVDDESGTTSGEQEANQVLVPDLIGEPADRAEVRLIALGLVVATEDDPASDEPAGTVIAQSVAPGEPVDEGATITIVISAGSSSLVVPDLAGETGQDAVAELRRIGFRDVTVEREPSQNEPVNVVLRTDPASGTGVSLDTPIVLVVSSGLEIATVPNVIGQPESQARSTLEDAGFDVEVVDVDGDEEGVVVGQTPGSGGQRVLPATVTIEVGRAS